MRYEFDAFCLDAARRVLTLERRELPLQPKAFDLLLYLIEQRDRVVSKDELLDALWPDTVVSEGSLKRAVSLVRGALRAGGAHEVIRTHQRQGYRFCHPDVVEQPAAAASGGIGAGAAPGLDALGGAELEQLGRGAHHAGRARDAIAPLQRAVAQFASEGDGAGAARCAFHLAQLHFEQRELTVGRGWLGRGARYLAPGVASAEHGYHAWLSSRFAVAEGDIDEAVRQGELANEIGRQLSDGNLEALGLLYKGLALVARGEVRRGCAHHDEAAAAVLSADVDPWVGGLVYCGMIFTCRNRADWRRASEWTDRFTELCDAADIARFPGTCRLHRAEVLHVHGALAEAEAEVTRICHELAETSPWAEGDGFHLLGNVHLARGALDAAEAAYRRAHELGWDPQPGLAMLQQARGQAKAAVRGLQSSLAARDWTSMQRRGMLLSQLVEIALAAEDPQAARQALEELDQHPELWQTPALEAAVSEARAAIARHGDDPATAIPELRRALRLYQEIGAPLNVGRVRIRLAQALLARSDATGAELELQAAARAIADLGAAPLEAELECVRAGLPK